MKIKIFLVIALTFLMNVSAKENKVLVVSKGAFDSKKKVIVEAPLFGYVTPPSGIPYRFLSAKIFVYKGSGFMIEPVVYDFANEKSLRSYGSTFGYFLGNLNFFNGWMFGLKGVFYKLKDVYDEESGNVKDERFTGVFADFDRYHLYWGYLTLRYGGSVGMGLTGWRAEGDLGSSSDRKITYTKGFAVRLHLDLGFAL